MKQRYAILVLLVLSAMSLALAACGGGSGETTSPPAAEPTAQPVSLGDPELGKQQYDTLCIACHGPTGEGVEGLGKPFTTSDFVPSKTDDELLEFIKTGRPISDPLNTTGVDMPPKGGNPALTDEQILDIIAYVRSLHN